MIIQYYKGDFKYILDNVTDIRFQHSVGEKDKKYTLEEFWREAEKYDNNILVSNKETPIEINKLHKTLVTFVKNGRNYIMLIIEGTVVYLCNDNGKTLEQINLV